jgi:hypothetical protein
MDFMMFLFGLFCGQTAWGRRRQLMVLTPTSCYMILQLNAKEIADFGH